MTLICMSIMFMSMNVLLIALCFLANGHPNRPPNRLLSSSDAGDWEDSRPADLTPAEPSTGESHGGEVDVEKESASNDPDNNSTKEYDESYFVGKFRKSQKCQFKMAKYSYSCWSLSGITVS